MFFSLGLKKSNTEILLPKIALCSITSYVYVMQIKSLASSIPWRESCWVCGKKKKNSPGAYLESQQGDNLKNKVLNINLKSPNFCTV